MNVVNEMRSGVLSRRLRFLERIGKISYPEIWTQSNLGRISKMVPRLGTREIEESVRSRNVWAQ